MYQKHIQHQENHHPIHQLDTHNHIILKGSDPFTIDEAEIDTENVDDNEAVSDTVTVSFEGYRISSL